MNQRRLLISLSLLILSSMLFSASTPAAVAATAAPKQEVPATVQPTKVVPVFMTVNDVRYSAQTGMYEPLMIYNK